MAYCATDNGGIPGGNAFASGVQPQLEKSTSQTPIDDDGRCGGLTTFVGM